MRIRILEATVCDGRMVDAGEEVETSRETAQLLVGNKKAEYLAARLPVEKAVSKRATGKATLKD